MFPIKCESKWSKDSRRYQAVILSFVKVDSPDEFEFVSGRTWYEVHSRAIVCFLTMARGTVMEVPLSWVKIDDDVIPKPDNREEI